MQLARSLLYTAAHRLIRDSIINYVTPAKLRIWGGNGFCNKAILLAESELIIHNKWQKFDFNFKPDQDYSHIIFEAYYKTPTLFPYNGHILLDDASALYEIPCTDAGPMIDSLKQRLAKEKNLATGQNDRYRKQGTYGSNLRVYEFAKENWEKIAFKKDDAQLTEEGEETLRTILSKYEYQPYQEPITVRLDFEKGDLSKKRIKVIKKIFAEYYFKIGFDVNLVKFEDLDTNWEFQNEQIWMTLNPKS